MMLSPAVRRSALPVAMKMVAGRSAAAAATARAAFSTQTTAQVGVVENMLKNKHWTDVQDEMICLKKIMNESKTNHAIKIPDETFEHQVAQNIQEIQRMLDQSNVGHVDVYNRIHSLKLSVRDQLYQFA